MTHVLALLAHAVLERFTAEWLARAEQRAEGEACS